MRLDKWIWAVRMFRTRSLATKFCNLKKVRVNGKTEKPAKSINIGDKITVEGKLKNMQYKVLGFIEKQTSAEKVAVFFEDLSPPETQESKEFGINAVPNTGKSKSFSRSKKYRKDQGRPTKRERRKLDTFFGE